MLAWRSFYREVVLKEKPATFEGGFIPLGAITAAIAPANGGAKRSEEVGELRRGD